MPVSIFKKKNIIQVEPHRVAIVERSEIGPDHPHILVVDDEEAIRNLIQKVVRKAGYACSIVPDGEEALNFLKDKTIDVVITDIIMPGLNGVELTKLIKKKYSADVIVMTGLVEGFTYEEILEKGASDFIEKPLNIRELMVRLKRVLRERAVLAERNQAEKKLKKTIKEIVQAIALTVEMRDPYTAGHQKRVANLAGAIAKEMNFSKEQIDAIVMAGIIHDLGKMSIPAEILSKPGRLTEPELNIIKTHPQVGYDILKTIEFPWPVAQIVLQHHERLDGSGYPQGLLGAEIIMEARILAVADVVEAMASHRPYRAALGINKALEEISQHSGVGYDPTVVNACLKLFTENRFIIE
jgi:putative nucleotidyltransferase with HDIG domain